MDGYDEVTGLASNDLFARASPCLQRREKDGDDRNRDECDVQAIVEQTADADPSIRHCIFNDYDDFLHRGTKSPLREMPFVLYQAYVEVVPLGRSQTIPAGAYFFRTHYEKAASHVQVIRSPPRGPRVHGFTMPTWESDREIHACFKLCLLCPTECCSPEGCAHVTHALEYMSHSTYGE